MTKIVIVGSPETGEIRTLYSPEAIELFSNLSKDLKVKRVSHIEVENDENGHFKGFYVDLSPVKGPIKKGFLTRQEALAFEHEWLEKNNIPFPD